jgi:hypothetical protein
MVKRLHVPFYFSCTVHTVQYVYILVAKCRKLITYRMQNHKIPGNNGVLDAAVHSVHNTLSKGGSFSQKIESANPAQLR